LSDLAALAYKDVIHEPVVCCSGGNSPALIADLGICSVWLPQTEMLFDIRVTDVDAPSYVHCSVADVLATAEVEKRCKYRAAAEERHASFSPRLMMQWDMMQFCFCVVWKGSCQLDWRRVTVKCWGQLSFAVIRAMHLCLRGSRVCWRSGMGIWSPSCFACRSLSDDL